MDIAFVVGLLVGAWWLYDLQWHARERNKRFEEQMKRRYQK